MAAAMGMSETSTEEYTKKMRARYGRLTGRKARGKLLDEFIEITGWERKHANKVLLGARRRGKRGAPIKYGAGLIEALKTCWLAMEQPCGKRMKDMLPLWAVHLDCAEDIRLQLTRIGAASIDWLLRAFKVTAGKKVRPPKPASAVKSLVEVRAQSWDTSETGWTEVDTVAHCGCDMGGDFIWTLTSVEISSGWTELRAVWNRGQQASFEELESIWESQPFDLLGVDSDNGGEFLNFHLCHWLKKHGIHQTRSRPYYKNDQAYVEQKTTPTSASSSATSGSNIARAGGGSQRPPQALEPMAQPLLRDDEAGKQTAKEAARSGGMRSKAALPHGVSSTAASCARKSNGILNTSWWCRLPSR